MEVSTKEDRIANVLRLDQSLGRFLAFIVIAGGAGGLGALASSIYLSVQRSRRQFAVLQILGVPHSTVILSVALQSVVIVMLGSLATLTLFNIGSWMLAGNVQMKINFFESADLNTFAPFTVTPESVSVVDGSICLEFAPSDNAAFFRFSVQ